MFRYALSQLFEAARFNPVLWLAIKHEHGRQETFERFEFRLRLGALGLAFVLALPALIRMDFLWGALQLWFIGFVFSYALGFGADAAYVLAARFGSELRGEFWEALRLTLLPASVIVEGKYLNGQLRVWRWLILEGGVRLFISAWLIFSCALFMLAVGVGQLIFFGWIFLAIAASMLYLYISEPIMRMRTMVALGFAMVLRTQNETAAALIAVGVAFAIRFAQIIFILSLPVQSVFTVRGYGAVCIVGLLPWLQLLLFYALFVGVYQWIRGWSLGVATRRLHTSD
ncbi:MAG: hypothetical protein SNJ58_05690 [Aggregatilineales bacterium]